MKSEAILQKIKTAYDGQPWFGPSFIKILSDVTNPNAHVGNGNAIGQILAHALAWRIYVIEKLKGNANYELKVNSEKDWQKEKSYNQQEWETLLHEFHQSQVELTQLLEARADEDSWLSTIVPGRKFNFESLIEGIFQHDIYHFGQIALLK